MKYFQHLLLLLPIVLLSFFGRVSDMDKTTKDFFSKIHLLIATPCYGGMVTEQYTRSMMYLSSTLASAGVQLSYVTIANESLVTRARNELVNVFIQEKSYTHLMFIDADISFQANSVLHMLVKDKDVIAGAYPLKVINWDELYEKRDEVSSPKEMENAAINYVINVEKPDPSKVGVTEEIVVNGGTLPVYDAGTGFMIIKRNVFSKIINAYPEILYYADKDMTVPKEQRKMYAFFDTSIDEDGRYLSEDYTFCRRWQKLGGQIHLDINVVLNHAGSYVFRGHSIFNK